MLKTATLNDVIELARQLSLLDKVRLIERITPEIERDIAASKPAALRSLWGLCADLGAAPSAEDIDQMRSDTWAGFPRGDI